VVTNIIVTGVLHGVNFRGLGISRGARKLTRIPMLIKNKMRLINDIFHIIRQKDSSKCMERINLKEHLASVIN
jgi:hypothetical protein